MRLPAQTTVAKCEEFLKKIEDGHVGELLIPKNIKFHAVGGEVSWIQFLLTWAVKHEAPQFRTYQKSPTASQIEDSVSRLYGLVVALCGGTISAVDSKSDISDASYNAAIMRLRNLQGGDPFDATRGPKVEIVAADHIGKNTPLFLYRKSQLGDVQLRDREQFIRLARYLIRKVTPSRSNTVKIDGVTRAIGNLLYETFRNTEDHAMRSIDGDLLPLSIRLLQVSEIGLSRETMASTAGGFAPLERYFKSIPDPLIGKQLHFLIVSVLDSGPGLASTWTGKPISELSIEDEVTATRDCFTEGTRKRHDRYGQGLPLVRSILSSHRGFLTLRTGRTSFFYNGLTDHDDAIDGAMPLESWVPDGERSVAPVVGAFLTLIIPLGIES